MPKEIITRKNIIGFDLLQKRTLQTAGQYEGVNENLFDLSLFKYFPSFSTKNMYSICPDLIEDFFSSIVRKCGMKLAWSLGIVGVSVADYRMR